MEQWAEYRYERNRGKGQSDVRRFLEPKPSIPPVEYNLHHEESPHSHLVRVRADLRHCRAVYFVRSSSAARGRWEGQGEQRRNSKGYQLALA